MTRKYRTELCQLIHILDYVGSCSKPLINSISNHSNMSYHMTAQNCKILVNGGLLETSIINKSKKYRLTEHGRSFLNNCRSFQSLLDSYKLNILL